MFRNNKAIAALQDAFTKMEERTKQAEAARLKADTEALLTHTFTVDESVRLGALRDDYNRAPHNQDYEARAKLARLVLELAPEFVGRRWRFTDVCPFVIREKLKEEV